MASVPKQIRAYPWAAVHRMLRQIERGERFLGEPSSYLAAPAVQQTISCHPNYTLPVMDVAAVICKG